MTSHPQSRLGSAELPAPDSVFQGTALFTAETVSRLLADERRKVLQEACWFAADSRPGRLRLVPSARLSRSRDDRAPKSPGAGKGDSHE
jgi:hypothetical protein